MQKQQRYDHTILLFYVAYFNLTTLLSMYKAHKNELPSYIQRVFIKRVNKYSTHGDIQFLRARPPASEGLRHLS